MLAWDSCEAQPAVRAISARGACDHGRGVSRPHPTAGASPGFAPVQEMIEVSLEAVGVELVEPVPSSGPVVLSNGLDEVVLDGHVMLPGSTRRKEVGRARARVGDQPATREISVHRDELGEPITPGSSVWQTVYRRSVLEELRMKGGAEVQPPSMVVGRRNDFFREAGPPPGAQSAFSRNASLARPTSSWRSKTF